MTISIKSNAEDVLRYLSQVQRAADSDRNALGWLPDSAYEQAAVQGKLLVATWDDANSPVYAGHLMFGGRYAQATIFQLFVAANFRGKGLASTLVSALKVRLTAESWLSIKAGVAADLAANATWEKLGFRVLRTRPGGEARKRLINVRATDLETPSLFSLAKRDIRSKLSLAERYALRPVYLFDLNVLFDAMRDRGRKEEAGLALRAGFASTVRLFISEEFLVELARNSRHPNDPLLTWARQLDRLIAPPEKFFAEISAQLAPVVFPDRARQGCLTERDESDLAHLATAIHHGVAGFITSEKAILRARDYLQTAWGVDVVGLEEFASAVDPGARSSEVASVSLETKAISTRQNVLSDLAAAKNFLSDKNAASPFLSSALDCHGREANWISVTVENKLVAYAKWSAYGGLHRSADLYLCVDEEADDSDLIAEHLLDVACRWASANRPALVNLHLLSNQPTTRQTAIAHGFSTANQKVENGELKKLAVGRIVDRTTWPQVRNHLRSSAIIDLPPEMPHFSEAEHGIRIHDADGDVTLDLGQLETALGPVLFLFPGRGGAIVPIRETFSRDLIGGADQLTLFSGAQATLRKVRAYYSTPRAYHALKPGNLLLFYQSGSGMGRSSIIAVARIIGRRIVSKNDAVTTAQSLGVLDACSMENLSKSPKTLETVFDNLFVLKKPVTLRRLKELGCHSSNNFQTASPISSANLAKVVSEGMSDD